MGQESTCIVHTPETNHQHQTHLAARRMLVEMNSDAFPPQIWNTAPPLHSNFCAPGVLLNELLGRGVRFRVPHSPISRLCSTQSPNLKRLYLVPT